MIYIYGDSHALFSFDKLSLPHNNLQRHSITMFRIGRDNSIINFDSSNMIKDDIIVLSYGEVDCRCHIHRQILYGKKEDDIINEIVGSYFRVIQNNTIGLDVKIIVVGVIPPTKQYDYEIIHGPVTHEFPFVGSDEDRVRYTYKVNKLLEEKSKQNNYIYFNGYSDYTRSDGTLNHDMSDRTFHLGDNSLFLEKFIDLHKKITT